MEERAAKLECKDDNEKCQEWAASGQCQSNRTFMVSLLLMSGRAFPARHRSPDGSFAT